MRVEVRVREAEVGFAEERTFLGRRQGVGDAGEVEGVDGLGLPRRSATRHAIVEE